MTGSQLEALRRAEHEKYDRAYALSANYRMSAKRRIAAVADLKGLSHRGALLDVACGQGDMLREARRLGFAPARGTEIVEALLDPPRVVRAEVHDLPFEDSSFDVVTMFDVIEHLVPGDDRRACAELARVARRHVLLTANDKDSFNKAGEQLHINQRPYKEWDSLFREWFPGKVIWLAGGGRLSECWRVDLA